MTSPDRRAPAAQAGFTLIELLVAMTILGLALALVTLRGPSHRAALEARAAAADLAQGLREARARAIMGNEPVELTLDLTAHSWRIGNSQPHRLPPVLAVTLFTAKGDVTDESHGGIVFEPDGSSTGGHIALGEGARQRKIAVDWLTGNVSVSDGR
jgi:general secretion pathway protein H